MNLLAGPYYRGSFDYISHNNYSHSLDFEPGYIYEFSSNLIKMRETRREYIPKVVPGYGLNLMNRLSDEVLTEKAILEIWANHVNEQKRNNTKYSNPHSTSRGYGKVKLEISDNSILHSKKIVNILITNHYNPNEIRVYRGNDREFHQFKSGYYRFIFLLENDQYVVQNHVYIKHDGTNYLVHDNKDIREKDKFSEEISEIINKGINGKNNFEPLNIQELNEIKNRSYNKFKESSSNYREHRGKVTDEEGLGIPGVNVHLKGTNTGTITDINGEFLIYVPAEARLVFSFIGYMTEEVYVGYSSSTTITLKPDINKLEEVVVIGYGVQKKSMVTGSITQLQGKATGVSIRGNKTVIRTPRFRHGDSESGWGWPSDRKPLIILNGMPYTGDLNDLPQEVLSNMKILEGEAASSIYGARAADGVYILNANKETLQNSPAHDFSEYFPQEASAGLRTNFSDYAFWQPRLRSDKDGKASFQVKFPDDITSWKTFVLGMGDKKLSGSAQAETRSFKAVMASIDLPRFIVEGDVAKGFGKVLNYTHDSINVSLLYELNEVKLFEKKISFLTSFVDTLIISTSAKDSVSVKYILEKEDGYSDGELRYIKVYPAGTLEHSGNFYTLNSDTSFTIFNKGFDKDLHLVAQADVLELLLDEMNFIHNYRYLCNEQLASKLKALLMEKKVRESMKESFKKDKALNGIIKKLQDAKRPEGTWGWWPESEGNSWITKHVVDALLGAKAAGYNVKIDEESLSSYFVYHMDDASFANLTDYLYVLKRLNTKVNYEKYIRELDNVKQKSFHQQMQLLLLKQDLKLPYQLDSAAIFSRNNLTVFGNMYWGKDDYSITNNATITTALVYKILKNHGGYESTLEKIRNYFLEKRSSGYWRNTYESAIILETILPDILKGSSENRRPEPSRLQIASSETVMVTEFPFEKNFGKVEKIEISKSGGLPLYLSIFQSYQNKTPERVDSLFKMESFFKGRAAGSPLEAGKSVTMVVKVEVKKEAEFVMIEVPIPAGCSYDDKKRGRYPEVHREYFREKTSIFCSELKKGTYEFEINLLPRFTGNYHLNPAKVELMYFPVFFGREEMKELKIY